MSSKPTTYTDTVSNKAETDQKPSENPFRHIKVNHKQIYAYRITAIYIYAHIVAYLFGFDNRLSVIKTQVLLQLIGFLTSIGFAPANVDLLPDVMKVGWLLIITGFNPLSLIFGLPIYIFMLYPTQYPVTFLLNRYARRIKEAPPKPKIDFGEEALWLNPGPGLIKRKRNRFPLLAILTTGLLGWVLLYGGTTSRLQVIPAVVMAGMLLVTLLLREFQRASPHGEVQSSLLRTLVRFGRWINKQVDSAVDVEYDHTNYTLYRVSRYLARSITLMVRSQRAFTTLSLKVLGEYVLSLILVSCAAILIWALIMKAWSPMLLNLSTSLQLSVSYFLQGIERPLISGDRAITPPFWIQIGSTMTVWILFVVYIGPAGSLLPDRQRATSEQLKGVYQTFRTLTLKLRRRIVNLERLKKSLNVSN